MTELCRVCMLISQDVINIFDEDPESEFSIVHLISHYTGLEVKRGDSFPEIVCSMCLQDARDTFGNFRLSGESHQTDNKRKDAVLLEEKVSQMLHCQVKEEFLEEDLLQEIVCEISDSESEQSYLTQEVNYSTNKEELNAHQETQQLYVQNCGGIEDNKDCDNDDPPLKSHDCEKHYCHLQLHECTHVGRKPFKCTQCPKTCRTAADLRRHNRIHTGERPYKCDYCEKTFRDRQVLRVHIRVHTGERPYKCTYCEKTYKEPKSLRVHTRSHTGERPYKCSYCLSTFADPSSFRTHTRIHKRKTI
ncbi:zinc finger protein 845-like [Drosophila eugracilis]|uniref:zinc finger protein 845-like n=1 Tax=Drosophila eugracilis TaxID=29029 RepID=UPI0007E719C7|nr:zinc finger protein 845-like [Drosophila eugracilis]